MDMADLTADTLFTGPDLFIQTNAAADALSLIHISFIGPKSERVQSSRSMSSKIFIEFVALIVRNRIYNLLKEQMIRMETKQKYMTVPAAIRELEKIEIAVSYTHLDVYKRQGIYYAYECRNWAVSPKVHDAVLRADNQMLVATPFNNIWVEK